MARRSRRSGKKAGATIPKLPGDLGAVRRWRHDPVTVEQVSDENRVRHNRARVYSRNPLETYFRRRLIDERQKEAGEVLGRLWQSAGIEPRVVARYEEYVDAGRAAGHAIRKGEAYERWRKAVDAVGPVAADEVITVCCEEEAVGGVARMEILRRGLDVLAGHFGM